MRSKGCGYGCVGLVKIEDMWVHIWVAREAIDVSLETILNNWEKAFSAKSCDELGCGVVCNIPDIDAVC